LPHTFPTNVTKFLFREAKLFRLGRLNHLHFAVEFDFTFTLRSFQIAVQNYGVHLKHHIL
jgi:hypothetical protein